MDPLLAGYAVLVVFVAYVVRGVAGFGSGLISIPLLAIAFPIHVVVPVVVALDYIGSASQGIRNRRQIHWKDLLPLLPFTGLGVVCALILFNMLHAEVLTRSLGTFVMLYAIYQLLPLPPLRGSRISAIPYGFLGGLVGTLFGTGGPFYVVYLTMRGLEKTAFRASFATWFLVDGTMRLAGYSAVGIFDLGAAKFLAAALPVALAGLWLGGRVQLQLQQRTFKHVISMLLVISGFALITKAA